MTVRAEIREADASLSIRIARRAASIVAAYALAILATAFFAFPLVWITLSSMRSEADVSAYPPTWIFFLQLIRLIPR